MFKFFVDRVTGGHPENRGRAGTAAGIAGIFFNLVLFFFKLIAGTLSNSAAITADAFNNLSDIGSSVITFAGFKMSEKPADSDHPFGHGRIEYITGLFVAVAIILMGFELGKSSVMKIIHPETVNYTLLSAAVLLFSVAVKLFMFFFYSGISKEISSPALKATAQDSLSDSIATGAVLLGIGIAFVFKINIDGILGLAVALLIFISGLQSIIDTVNPMLGEAADPKLVEAVKEEVLSNRHILGIHDLMIHNYGPSKIIMSLHAEVPSNGNVLELHDVIDNMEKQLRDKFRCEAVIHMDPIVIDDARTNEMRRRICGVVSSIDKRLSMHDFRMTDGHTHTNLIFDVAVPFDFRMTDSELVKIVQAKVKEIDSTYYAVINIDKVVS